MIFKIILQENMNLSTDLVNNEWVESNFNFNNKDTSLFNFFKFGELCLLDKALKLNKSFKLPSFKTITPFYLLSDNKKELTKLSTKIKNSELLKYIDNKYSLKGISLDVKNSLLKKVVINKMELLANDIKNIYKTYMFNYLFISVVEKNLLNRLLKYELNSFILPNFSVSNTYYACYEYFINLNKEDFKWINKMESYFDIFKKEIQTISFLIHSLIEDIFSNSNYLLTFDEYKSEFVNLILSLSKNIKYSKINKPTIINNIYDEINNLNINSCEFKKLIYIYDRLEKNLISNVSNEFKDIKFNNFNIFISYGKIKSEIIMPEINDNYLNLYSNKKGKKVCQ